MCKKNIISYSLWSTQRFSSLRWTKCLYPRYLNFHSNNINKILRITVITAPPYTHLIQPGWFSIQKVCFHYHLFMCTILYVRRKGNSHLHIFSVVEFKGLSKIMCAYTVFAFVITEDMVTKVLLSFRALGCFSASEMITLDWTHIDHNKAQ